MFLEDGIGAIASRLEKFITTKTVVGDPIVIGNVTINPFR